MSKGKWYSHGSVYHNVSKGKWDGHGSYYHMWVKRNDTVMKVIIYYHMWVKGNDTVMEVIITCE